MGLGFGTSGSLDESGAVRTGSYHEWMAEQQKGYGKYHKYAREQREELAAERKRQAGQSGQQLKGGNAAKKSWKKSKGWPGATASGDV